MNSVEDILVGREREARRLREAVLSRQSLMIAGANGVGKTALILNVIAGLPPSIKQRCLYIKTFRDLRDLLYQLATALYGQGDSAARRELRAAGITKTLLKARAKHFASSQLRGSLYRAIQGKGYRTFLDHCPALTPSAARVAKELFWMRQTPVYIVPKTDVEIEIAKAGRNFYWNEPQILRVGPLAAEAARELIEHCIEKYGLHDLDLAGVREEILALSGLAPGPIVAMCRMAANPHYQSDSRVKTKLIHIDYLMRGRAASIKPVQTGRRG